MFYIEKTYFVIVFLSLFAFMHANASVKFITSSDTTDVDTLPVFSVTADPAFIYASRSRNPLTVSSIDQAKIEKLTEPTIEPLLNSLPGAWMQTGALNTNRISIRGVGYREPFATTGIKIYLDDIPLTNGAGESSIEDIHPLLFSGIDVWRGPSSALWGSGLGGMVHLKTKFPEENIWNAQVQVGSFNRIQTDHHISFRYGKNKTLGSVFHYQFLNDDGYRDNNQYQKHSFTWGQQWQNNRGLTIKSFLHAIDLKAYIPSSINEIDYKNNFSIAAPTWDAVNGNEDYLKYIAGIHAAYSRSDKWLYQAALFGTFFHSDEVRPFNILDESNVSFGTRHRYTISLNQHTHLNAGFEYFRENYEFSTFETLEGGQAGIKLSEQKENRNYANIFLQSEIDLAEKWILFGGIHFSLNTLSGQNVVANFPLAYYPTIGVNYIVMSNVSLSANISRGYSNLSLDDVLNSSGILTPAIVPETGWSEEIALLIGDLNSRHVRIGLYHMDIDNSVITIRIADDIFEKANAGSSVHDGIEAGYRLLPANSKFNIEGSYTYSYHRNPDNAKPNELPGTPKHRTYHRLALRPFHSLECFAIHHFISDVFLNDANTAKADGYQLLNAGIFYHWLLNENWKMTFSCNVHNLLDSHYSSMFQINAPSVNGSLPRYYYPGKPRSVYGAFSIKYLIGKAANSG